MPKGVQPARHRERQPHLLQRNHPLLDLRRHRAVDEVERRRGRLRRVPERPRPLDPPLRKLRPVRLQILHRHRRLIEPRRPRALPLLLARSLFERSLNRPSHLRNGREQPASLPIIKLRREHYVDRPVDDHQRLALFAARVLRPSRAPNRHPAHPHRRRASRRLFQPPLHISRRRLEARDRLLRVGVLLLKRKHDRRRIRPNDQLGPRVASMRYAQIRHIARRAHVPRGRRPRKARTHRGLRIRRRAAPHAADRKRRDRREDRERKDCSSHWSTNPKASSPVSEASFAVDARRGPALDSPR